MENGVAMVGLRRSVLVRVKPDVTTLLASLLPDGPVKSVVEAYAQLLEAK